MQINLANTVDKYDHGYGFITVHSFADRNLERINSFSNSFMMNFISESVVRLYFTLYHGSNVTVQYDFMSDRFYCDFCDSVGSSIARISHVADINRIVDKIEEYYVKSFREVSDGR